MNNQFLSIASLLIVIPAFLLQSCSEGKVEVEISVYGPTDCGTSTQPLDNQTELKIWAFEKKGDCSAEGSATISFTGTDNVTSLHLLSFSIPRRGNEVQTLKIAKDCKAFSLSEQDFKASKCIAGLTGKK